MQVLVTGATGTVGREVVRALLERGHAVRALSRDPATAALPAEVEVVRGDLTDPTSLAPALQGVEAVHLITFDAPRGSGGGAPLTEVKPLLAQLRSAGVRRVTVLQNGYPGPLEAALAEQDAIGWTILQPVELMANMIGDWAEQIRAAGRVEEPYVDRLSAMVHEADIGDVAALALIGGGYEGAELVITGPRPLTLRDKLDAVTAATGREVELVELTVEEAEARWRAQGMDDETIAFSHWIYGDGGPEIGRTPSGVVEHVTGRPAREVTAWAAAHADAFR